jgi:hypothetical protein
MHDFRWRYDSLSKIKISSDFFYDFPSDSVLACSPCGKRSFSKYITFPKIKRIYNFVCPEDRIQLVSDGKSDSESDGHLICMRSACRSENRTCRRNLMSRVRTHYSLGRTNEQPGKKKRRYRWKEKEPGTQRAAAAAAGSAHSGCMSALPV